ncbi:NACHT domain-containing protein [Serratia liquefaciens]|nr:NACHT domain-containing protein [Serratia liquefaciens]
MMIASAFLGGVFKQLGTKTVDAGIGKTNGLLRSFKNEKKLNSYLDRAVHKVFVFRTITKGDRDVYLDEVYHPVKIKLKNKSGKNRPKTIDDGFIIKSETCTTIIGLAGQGKTTMMRKLYLEELIKKDRVPFFITLRQFEYSSKISCEDILLEHLNLNGMDCEVKDVIELLKTGNVVFYFDGFDEIKFSERNNALKMICSIHDKYGCSSIVTTRPETEITRQPGVELYTVEKLNKDDVEAIIKRVIGNDSTSDTIIASLNKNRYLKSTINTPILIDILIVTSSLLSDSPNSICDYYDHLFTALMHRHDLSKNYTREKKSNLGNKELEDIFGFFSFFSYIESKSDFTLELMNKFFEKACSVRRVISGAENVGSDILDGTNLIIRDGYNSYVYIHRSIQEYFSAKCISMFSDEQKASFFKKYTNLIRRSGSENLLYLYRLIDPVGFYKYYLIPFLSLYGANYETNFSPLNKDEIIKVVDEWTVGIGDEAGGIENDNGNLLYPSALTRSGNDNKYTILSCLYNSLSLCGISIRREKYSEHLMVTCCEVIAKFVFSPENKDKTFQSKDKSFGITENYTWVKLRDVKDIIPQFEEKVLDCIYSEYLKMLVDIRNVIEIEYTRLIESDFEVSKALKDMGF